MRAALRPGAAIPRALTTALCTAVAVTALAAAAQNAPDRIASEAAKRLDALARSCADAGWHSMARQLWWEVVTVYDRDHERARAGLGQSRVGSVWSAAAHGAGLVPDRVSDAARRRLERQRARAFGALASLHARAARAARAARGSHGAPDAARADWHRRRAFRFRPDDARLAAELELVDLGDGFGTAVERRIVERSRRLRQVMALLHAHEPRVDDVAPEIRQRHLDAAGVAHRGVATAHFRVFGNVTRMVLVDTARHAERGLALARTLFAGIDGYDPSAPFVPELAVVENDSDYKKVLRANEHALPPEGLEFLETGTDFVPLGEDPGDAWIVWARDRDALPDLAVRWQAQSLSRFESEALVEGIGHAVACLYFGRTRAFLVGLAGARTETGADTNPALGELGELIGLAVEDAWSRADTPAARLPLLDLAAMKLPDRLKAWSLVDYLLRRDPSRIVDLDRAGADWRDSRVRVDEAFARRAGVALGALENDWRAFWTEREDLRERSLARAVDELPAPPIADWLSAIHALRVRAGVAPVGWTLTRAGDGIVVQGGDLLVALDRDAALRDLLLRWDLGDLAIARAGAAVVLAAAGSAGVRSDIDAPALATRCGPGVVYPTDGQRGVTAPSITLHFGADLGAAAADLGCEVRIDGHDVTGHVRRSERPGLYELVPDRTWPKSARIDAVWSWTDDDGALVERRTTFWTR